MKILTWLKHGRCFNRIYASCGNETTFQPFRFQSICGNCIAIKFMGDQLHRFNDWARRLLRWESQFFCFKIYRRIQNKGVYSIRLYVGYRYNSNVGLSPVDIALQWRHNERDAVSNQRRLGCLLNRLFRRRSKKTTKLRVTGLRAGKSPVSGEFPALRASNAETVSI